MEAAPDCETMRTPQATARVARATSEMRHINIQNPYGPKLRDRTKPCHAKACTHEVWNVQGYLLFIGDNRLRQFHGLTYKAHARDAQRHVACSRWLGGSTPRQLFLRSSLAAARPSEAFLVKGLEFGFHELMYFSALASSAEDISLLSSSRPD